jgi:hypothetical protein
MAANNIDQRIRHKEGSNKPEKPHKKLNGNVFSIFPIPHEKPWYLDKPQEDNGDNGVERSVPPQPYGPETFGWPEYKDYLDKLRPGAVPLSFPKFMDQLDLSPQDFYGRAPRRKEEGLLSLITPRQQEELIGMVGAFINANRRRA